jgi:hypothetical protein
MEENFLRNRILNNIPQRKRNDRKPTEEKPGPK